MHGQNHIKFIALRYTALHNYKIFIFLIHKVKLHQGYNLPSFTRVLYEFLLFHTHIEQPIHLTYI